MKVKELIEELKTFDPEQEFGIVIKRGNKEGETNWSLEYPEEIISGDCYDLQGKLYFDEGEAKDILNDLFRDLFPARWECEGSEDAWVKQSLEEASFEKGLVYMTVWV